MAYICTRYYNCVLLRNNLYHTIMKYSFEDLKETIRIKDNLISSIGVIVATGKDGDYYVAISPSFLVSGYGENEEEALADFEYNMDVLVEDLNALSNKDKVSYMQSLGFKNDLFHKKNYSKAYVDENGVLQGLEHAKVKTLNLEVV